MVGSIDRGVRGWSGDDGSRSGGSSGNRDRRGLVRAHHRRRRAEVSSRDDFLAHEVEADDPWDLVVLEVAAHRVADVHVQTGDVVGFGEDRLPKGPGGEASLGSLFNEEDHLGCAPMSF